MDKLLTPPEPLACVVAVLLVDLLKAHRSWGWLRLVAGASVYKSVPGVLCAKVMGSGHNGGFSMRPSATHQGLVLRFGQIDAALDFLHSEAVMAYRQRARECWGGVMAVTSARGHWDQQAWGLSDAPSTTLGPKWRERLPEPDAPMPLAVLTRASIHAAKAAAFWRHAPATQAALTSSPGCHLAVGLGEAPLVRQCTFSLWQDEAAMLGYAHHGAHQLASAAAHRQHFFSESLFVRMRTLRMAGQWQGHDFGNHLDWREVVHG